MTPHLQRLLLSTYTVMDIRRSVYWEETWRLSKLVLNVSGVLRFVWGG